MYLNINRSLSSIKNLIILLHGGYLLINSYEIQVTDFLISTLSPISYFFLDKTNAAVTPTAPATNNHGNQSQPDEEAPTGAGSD